MLQFLTSRRPLIITAGLFLLLLIILLTSWHTQSASSLSYTRLLKNHFGVGSKQDPFGDDEDALLSHIGNRTLGFQKIFMISLPQRTDLRDAATLAAAFTGLDIEFVDGVPGTDVSYKTLPVGATEHGLGGPGLGAWRAHMNVAKMIVSQNIQSALVLEGDVDWDLRIKSQMKQFALGSRLLLQPLQGTNETYLDPTNPTPLEGDSPTSFDIHDSSLQSQILPPTTSPYGDLTRWDLLWLGHCGCRFPWSSDENTPIGRAVIANDPTVAEKQHFAAELGDRQLIQDYPPHTRVVSRARVNSCTLGHAFSQKGARRFLYEVGLRKLEDPTDISFRYMCDGVHERPLATCLTVQPQLFQHHRAKGPKSAESDIDDHGEGFNEHGFTENVRWSTRLNLPRLIDGRTDYIDLYPDGMRGPQWVEDDD